MRILQTDILEEHRTMIDAQKRIAGAFLIGATLVAGAFFIRQQSIGNAPEGTLQTATVGRTYIKPIDSNADGVPNWQEELLGDEAITLSSASSTYEAPTTVTGKFGIRFFENFIRSKMYGVLGDSNEELIEESTKTLIAQAGDELFTGSDISIFETTDPQILRGYGNQVAFILTSHPTSGDSEAIILQDYMRYKKTERLHDIDPIADAYTTMVKNLLEIQVPAIYKKEHLNILNAVNAVREDIKSMQKVEEDPLYTLLRFKRYPDDVLGMSNAITDLFNTLYFRDGIHFRNDEPVSKLMVFPS